MQATLEYAWDTISFYAGARCRFHFEVIFLLTNMASALSATTRRSPCQTTLSCRAPASQASTFQAHPVHGTSVMMHVAHDYSSLGSSQCVSCPAGSFSNGSAFTCQYCPAGSISVCHTVCAGIINHRSLQPSQLSLSFFDDSVMAPDCATLATPLCFPKPHNIGAMLQRLCLRSRSTLILTSSQHLSHATHTSAQDAMLAQFQPGSSGPTSQCACTTSHARVM